MKTRTLPSIMALLAPFAAALSQVPDRSQPPAIGPPPEMKAPSVERLWLKNGLQIILVEKHDVPLVQINLQVMAGSVLDTKGNFGLASMTADLLDEGAGGRDALELADAIDYLGANLSTRAGYHTSVISLNTPLRQLDAALPLLADVALKPAFATADLDRKRDERLTAMIQARDEARSIASVQFNKAIFGKGHPYGRSASGNAAGLKALTAKKIGKFYNKYYRPNNAALIVVGDITADEIMPQLERYFGSWKKKRVKTPKWTDVSQVRGRTIYLVDKPGAAQSEIRIGRVGVPRNTVDYYNLAVLNTILGGAFTSRLNQNLREEHGYSYGARSSFNMRPHAGPFTASAAVQTDVTDKALTEFMKELNGILEEVPAEELSKSQNYVALGYPANFQTVARVASQLQNLVLYNLPDETFSRYAEGIYEVTSRDLMEAAAKYIDTGNMAIIVVGDRQAVEEGIQALNLGTIVYLTIEEVMGPVPTLGASK
ncbi:MAG: insulinase family protein [Candidatus Marinimicrobia bacterium]|nr:insulinase family protein [Candidatus Neomarinimicrobiota bacterium]